MIVFVIPKIHSIYYSLSNLLWPFKSFIIFVYVSLHQQKIPDNYVGFVNLPNQVYRKSVKRGFEFTLMVVGE